MGQLGPCESPRAMGSTTAPATTPIPQNGTVPPRPVLHAERRPREYLTPKEVERLITAARQNRYGHRDATMIQVAYRHGLCVSELCALRWDQVDFEHGLLHVRRIKNGTPSVHPLGGEELRALRKLQREAMPSRYVFTRACKPVGGLAPDRGRLRAHGKRAGWCRSWYGV
jgi:integrase